MIVEGMFCRIRRIAAVDGDEVPYPVQVGNQAQTDGCHSRGAYGAHILRTFYHLNRMSRDIGQNL